MSNLQVKRNELKYYISNIEYLALVSRLKHILKSDECLYEKQSGDMIQSIE